MSKVFFYLCPRETATKVHTFTASNGESLRKTKVGSSANIYRPLKSVSTGRLKTGLDELVENPYKTFSKDKITPGFESYIFEKEKIKLQHLLEYKHGVPPNTYTNIVPDDLVLKNEEKVPFFIKRTHFAKIGDSGLVLNLDKPEDELKYYWLKSSDKCAPSREKIKNGIHEYYIGMENEDEETKVKKMEMVDKAVYALMNPELTDEVKEKIAKKLDLVSRINSPQKIYSALSSYIKDSHKEQSQRISSFMDIINKLDDVVFKEKLNAEVLLKDLVDYYIVTNKSNTYEWRSKGIKLGYNKADAIEFLIHPKKQGEVEELQKELKAKLINY